MNTKLTLSGIDDVNELLSRIAPRAGQNIMRNTIHDMAKEVRDDAKAGMPEDEGTMKGATKHRREKVTNGQAASTVRVAKSAYYWRFLEYGDGPDGVAYDFFLKAVEAMRGDMNGRFLRAFGRKFEAALAKAGR